MKRKIMGKLTGPAKKTETKTNGPPKSSSLVLLKTAIIFPLVLFGLWLLKGVYFLPLEAQKTPAVSKTSLDAGIFQRILMDKKPVPRGHFHILDDAITPLEPFHPLCTNCHGTYPHGKEKKVRSLLNFHTGFMACSVCHVRKASDDRDYFFVWVDRQTGLTARKVKGGFGKYPAKIFPMQVTASGQKKLFRPVSEKGAEEFLRLKDKFTPDQVAQAKIKLHEGISKKPVFCIECHKKDGYFDFAKLGFPKNRVDHLVSTEVAGMIENYETFYFPEAIDFVAD
jgi:hypothetical protein